MRNAMSDASAKLKLLRPNIAAEEK